MVTTLMGKWKVKIDPFRVHFEIERHSSNLHQDHLTKGKLSWVEIVPSIGWPTTNGDDINVEVKS